MGENVTNIVRNGRRDILKVDYVDELLPTKRVFVRNPIISLQVGSGKPSCKKTMESEENLIATGGLFPK